MIAITGSENGFLSSHLHRSLQLNAPEFIRRDVRRSPKLLNEWLDNHKPDCVVHCAGLANVRLCIEDPTMAYQANTVDTITLLNCMEGRDIKLLYIATDKVFGDQEECRLTTGYKPLNSYDVSKVSAEIILGDWAQRNPCVLARFPNFYGSDDPHTERLIPSVLKAIREKRNEFVVRTNADARRQYIFIDDAVNYVRRLMFMDGSGRHHFGTNIIKSVREVVMDLCTWCGHSMTLRELNLGGEASKLSLAYESPLDPMFGTWEESLETLVIDSKLNEE